MIDELICSRLTNDTPLQQLLGSTDDEPRIDPLFTELETRAIVYNVVPVSYDKRLHRDRLELRIIESDARHLAAMTARVLELLVLHEQEPPLTHINTDGQTAILYACVQNGGGQLDDDNNIHKLLYFDIVWRCKQP